MKRLIIGGVILFLVTGCSANRHSACEWDNKVDADYNAAVDAIDSARSKNQYAIDNYLASSRADLIEVIRESNQQLEVARDRMIGSVGAAKLAASTCD
jgi:hypothetical protein